MCTSAMWVPPMPDLESPDQNPSSALDVATAAVAQITINNYYSAEIAAAVLDALGIPYDHTVYEDGTLMTGEPDAKQLLSDVEQGHTG